MTTNKVKSMGTLGAKFNHNFRKREVDNADPALSYLNEELVMPETDDKGNEMTYGKAWKQRMDELPYYKEHAYRKDAVRAIEVVMTFSRNDADDIDIEAWKRKNVEWLEKTFNVSPDGGNNVLGVTFHADEPGNPHCHAIIIPIDDKGHLNCKYFLDGSKKMSQLQTDYAKDMKEFNLDRGLERSQAKHQDIRRYYANLNRNIQYPAKEEGETFGDYINRVTDYFKTRGAIQYREQEESFRKRTEKLTKDKAITEEAIQKDLEAARALGLRDLQMTQRAVQAETEKKKKIEAETSVLRMEKSQLVTEINELKFKMQKTDALQKAETYDRIQKGMAIKKEEDPVYIQELDKMLRDMELLGKNEMHQEHADQEIETQINEKGR